MSVIAGTRGARRRLWAPSQGFRRMVLRLRSRFEAAQVGTCEIEPLARPLGAERRSEPRLSVPRPLLVRHRVSGNAGLDSLC